MRCKKQRYVLYLHTKHKVQWKQIFADFASLGFIIETSRTFPTKISQFLGHTTTNDGSNFPFKYVSLENQYICHSLVGLVVLHKTGLVHDPKLILAQLI